MGIEQKSIKDGGKTAVSLGALRKLFTDALGAPESCSIEMLKDWLQAPVWDDGKADSNCEVRARKLAPLLNRTGQPYSPSLETAVGGTTFQKKWELLDTKLNGGTVAVIKGPAEHVGGTESIFKKGFHALLFLCTGVDKKGNPFYVGFDPDISATEESRELWDKLVKQHQTVNKEVKNLEPEKLHQMITTMILGESGTGFGPLIRKYYPDRSKGFPKITRF